MEIGEVLSRAWQIISRYKALWIFGILASCTSTNTNSPNLRYSVDQQDLPPRLEQFFNQVPDWQWSLIIGAFIVVVLLVVVLFIFLGTMGRIGMIRGTLEAEEGATHLEFSRLFNASLPYFWRVFLLNLVVGLAFAAVVILMVILAIPMAITVIGLFCLIPMFCLLVPLAWVAGWVTEQGNIAIVVEDLSIMDGLQRGWQVVRDNLGNVIVMAILLTVISLVGGLIIGAPFVFIVGPAVIGALTGTRELLGGGVLVTGLCLLAYLPVMILINGILQGYIRSAWTLTFLRLTRQRSLVPTVPNLPA